MFQTVVVLFLHSTVLCLGVQATAGVLPGLPPAPASALPAEKPTLPGLAKLNALVASVANVTGKLATLPVAAVTSVADPVSTMVPCTCGVFLTGQFTRGSGKQPTGNPALLHEQDQHFPCSPLGHKQCANKCLEVIARHLPSSASIVCGSIDRDCFKERAYLWTKNCDDVWQNSNMSAGREFCCKDGLPYKCPLGKQ